MRRAAASLLLAVCPLAAQMPTLRTTARLVVAPTTVVDGKGHYVFGLTARDFELYDNGKRREIRSDALYEPLSLVLAVQSSEFSAEVLNKMHRIGSLVEPLLAGERGEAAVVSFDSEVRVVQALTPDFDLVARALRALSPGDQGGKMIDAVAESIRMLEARPVERRRVLLVVSESRDRGSKGKLEDAITAAQRNNVSVYPVTYSAYLTPFTAKPGAIPPPGGFDLLGVFREIGRLATERTSDAFATYTGGERLSFRRQRSLERALVRIGEELHSQYLLTFDAAPAEDNVFHAIEVKLPRHPGLRVRTRPGYWLSEPEAPPNY